MDPGSDDVGRRVLPLLLALYARPGSLRIARGWSQGGFAHVTGIPPCHRSARTDVATRGSCFSSRLARGHLMMGSEGWSGSIFWAPLPHRTVGSADITNSRHPSSP